MNIATPDNIADQIVTLMSSDDGRATLRELINAEWARRDSVVLKYTDIDGKTDEWYSNRCTDKGRNYNAPSDADMFTTAKRARAVAEFVKNCP